MTFIVGIDEVGRGALAGPVVVAAALVPVGSGRMRNARLGSLKDSKKLSAQQREAWLAHFHADPRIRFALARVYPRGIEKMNISAAANLAAKRAFARLAKAEAFSPRTKVFLDGGLFLGNGPQPKQAKTVIKGDEKIPAVAIASIAAKVSRDRFMRRLAVRYPAYGFEVHKGYGTKSHKKALYRRGPCEAHRLTFLGPRYKLF